MAVIQTLREYEADEGIYFICGRYKRKGATFRLVAWKMEYAGSQSDHWRKVRINETEPIDSLLPLQVDVNYLNQHRDVGCDEE